MTALASLAARPTTVAGRHRAVLLALLVATFVVILNETIMGVAIPQLMSDLGVTAETVQWLTTAFLLTMAVVIPMTGFLLQRLTTRQVFLTAMGLFCAGTLLSGVASGFWLLLVGRVVQASGTAIMLPLLMTTIMTLTPVERRGAVMGKVSIVISVAPAIGPTMSGLILQYLSWRFMFLLVLPVAAAATAYGGWRLTNVGEPGSHDLDVPSVLVSAVAFGGIVFGLSRLGGASAAAGPALAIGSLVVGLVCLGVFGVRQLRLQRHGHPLLDLRAFGYRMFGFSVALLCIAMMGLFGVVILLPIYLQDVRGLDVLQTGLLLLPGGLLMGLIAPTVGKIYDRRGPRLLAVTGAVLLTLSLWRFSTVGPATPVWVLVGLHLGMSLALALLFTPAFTTGLNPLPARLYSHGSAIMTTLQQVAGAAGTALLVTVMAGRSLALTEAGDPPLRALNGGIQTAFVVATVLAGMAIVLAAFLRSTPHEAVRSADRDSADV